MILEICSFPVKNNFANVYWPDSLKDTLNAFNDFKNKQKNVWSNAFWYVEICRFCIYVFNTLYIEIKHKCQKNSFGENKRYKKCPFFFFLQAPTHHSFGFNLRFLYELKYKIRLCKTVWGIFHCRFRFYVILYFCSTKYMDSLTLKSHNSF